MGRESEIVKERLRKIDLLKEKGIDAYAYRFDKKNDCAELQERYKDLKNEGKGKNVAIAGRILGIRSMGSIMFARLQDSTGQIQIVLQRDSTPKEHVEFFKRFIDSGDIVGIHGRIFRTKRGELSILLEKIQLLTKSIKPLPEKFHGLKDKEERYRRRYLDLIMNPEVKRVFETRNKIINAIREFLTKEGYMEVETPILQPIYGGTSARPFETELNALKMRLYLRISNELYLKRLIVGGYEKIFEFSRDFRNEGIDAIHNPEFTLMETMCAYADYNHNMNLVEEMLEFVVKKVKGTTRIKYQGKEIDFKRPWKRTSMIEAIKKFAKFDVEKASNKELKEKLDELKVEIPIFKRGVAIEEIFGAVVESKLIQPTIVYDFPYETCGLAKQKRENPEYSERFEPYINGWELGNVYSELNNPEILERYWKEQEGNIELDEESQRLDRDFLNALKVGMPPTSGIGIGIDRLVMLLTDQASIRDVILFPFMKPQN